MKEWLHAVAIGARKHPIQRWPGRVLRLLRLARERRVEKRALIAGAREISPGDLPGLLTCDLERAIDGVGRVPWGRMSSHDSERKVQASDFRRCYPSACEAVLREADLAALHRIDLLGSGLCDLGPTINWSQDFKSGFVWPKRHVSEMQLVDLSNDADVKVPWDLSRGFQLVRLAQAFWLSDNEAYAEEMLAQWRSWLRENPYLRTCNWGNAMEAAIRVANWLLAFTLTRDAKSQTREDRERLLCATLQHGRFIATHLERFDGSPTSNHLVSDYVGLVYIGCLLPQLAESSRFLSIGLNGLETEILIQTGGDGFCYEGSTNYHRLSAELFVCAFGLARSLDHTVSPSAWERAEAMVEATADYLRPDGLAPLIGDVDNGRLHMLTPERPDDHRSLLSVGAALFGRRASVGLAVSSAEGFWWGGKEGPSSGGEATRESHLFKDAQLAVLRVEDDYAILHAGTPRGPRGHFHNDSLSVELAFSGLSFVVDPGNYAYTSSETLRNEFRRTLAHNTIELNGVELNEIRPGALFDLGFRAWSSIDEWQPTPDGGTVVAHHRAYSELPGAPEHWRKVQVNRSTRECTIDDELRGYGEHSIVASYHLDPAVEVENGARGTRIRLTRLAASRPCVVEFHADSSFAVEPCWVSRGYGEKTASRVLRLRATVSLPHRWTVRFIVTA